MIWKIPYTEKCSSCNDIDKAWYTCTWYIMKTHMKVNNDQHQPLKTGWKVVDTEPWSLHFSLSLGPCGLLHSSVWEAASENPMVTIMPSYKTYQRNEPAENSATIKRACKTTNSLTHPNIDAKHLEQQHVNSNNSTDTGERQIFPIKTEPLYPFICAEKQNQAIQIITNFIYTICWVSKNVLILIPSLSPLKWSEVSIALT